MEIYILRHGKAQERSSTISSDAKRRLTEAGMDEMRDVAAGIASLGIRPSHIVSSPLVRAKETAAIVSARLSKHAEVVPRTAVWQELKPEANVFGTHRRLAGMAPDSAVMLVGHEPNLSLLASSMVLGGSSSGGSISDSVSGPGAGSGRGRDDGIQFRDARDSFLALKKGGMVIIRGNARGRLIHGTLRSLLTPKQLRMCRRV